MSEKVITDPELVSRGKSRVSMIQIDPSKLKASGSLAWNASKNMSRLRIRRKSFGFGGVPGIKPIDRTSQVGFEFKRPILTYMNTYQLEPSLKFNPAIVQIAIEESLDDHFTGMVYNTLISPPLALLLSGEIMRKVKEMQFNHYRIISVVTLGQKRSQSYNNAIAFLWDHERDNYVNVQREVTTAFIQVTCFVFIWTDEYVF